MYGSPFTSLRWKWTFASHKVSEWPEEYGKKKTPWLWLFPRHGVSWGAHWRSQSGPPGAWRWTRSHHHLLLNCLRELTTAHTWTLPSPPFSHIHSVTCHHTLYSEFSGEILCRLSWMRFQVTCRVHSTQNRALQWLTWVHSCYHPGHCSRLIRSRTVQQF